MFSRRARFRPGYLLVVLFPPVWSLFAIFFFGVADQFLYAALPAVAFLSGATLWTAGVFFRFRRQTGSHAAGLLGGAFLLWGLHHLDYPVLRARGAWNPWGYYLDIVFALLVGTGILLLVLEDLERGLGALSALSGDLQRGEAGTDEAGALLRRALTLRGVRGSALFDGPRGRFTRAVGTCAPWEGEVPAPEVARLLADVLERGHPVSTLSALSPSRPEQFAAALPVIRGERTEGALIILGDARDPFTALDDSFLRALGQQVGAALENADLTRRLRRRREELEQLSVRMVQQHEEERRRLSLELHDETAQVLAAVKLQLGVLREEVPDRQADRLGRVVELVDDGMAGIRRVTEELRPTLLDDLGLLPALRALATDFSGRTGLPTRFTGPDWLRRLLPGADLAIFRAVQEGLSNAARHAEATAVDVSVSADAGSLVVTVADDGRGPGAEPPTERMGLQGMRERLGVVGGSVRLFPRPGGGASLQITLPVAGEEEEA